MYCEAVTVEIINMLQNVQKKRKRKTLF